MKFKHFVFKMIELYLQIVFAYCSSINTIG